MNAGSRPPSYPNQGNTAGGGYPNQGDTAGRRPFKRLRPLRPALPRNPGHTLTPGGVASGYGYQGNIQSQQGNIPGYQGNLPGQQGNFPGYQGQQGNFPGYQGNLPGYQSNLPGYQGNLPDQQINLPGQQGNLPDQQRNFQNDENPIGLIKKTQVIIPDDPNGQLSKSGTGYNENGSNQPLAKNIADALEVSYKEKGSPLNRHMLPHKLELFLLDHFLKNDPATYDKVMDGLDIPKGERPR